MKFREGDYVVVNGEIERICAIGELNKMAFLMPSGYPRSLEMIAEHQRGYWHKGPQTVRTVRKPGTWLAPPRANFPHGIPCANTAQEPVWEQVAIG